MIERSNKLYVSPLPQNNDESPANYPQIGRGITKLVAEVSELLRNTRIQDEVDPDRCIIEPEIEAWLLVDAACHSSAALREAALNLARKRCNGELIGYLTGHIKFMGIDILTDKDCLVPRRETEIVGHAALEILAKLNHNSNLRIIDMCCGAGNLACGLASRLETARIWCADLTDSCINLTRRNIYHCDIADRVSVHQGDLFDALTGLDLEKSCDAIVCNPPYISTGRLDTDRASLLSSEPREAFDGGSYGLSIHQRILKKAPHYLIPGGWLFLEFGLEQERQLEILIGRSKVEYIQRLWWNDEHGRPRAVGLQLKAE